MKMHCLVFIAIWFIVSSTHPTALWLDLTAVSILEGFTNKVALDHAHKLLKAISEEKASKIFKVNHYYFINPTSTNQQVADKSF